MRIATHSSAEVPTGKPFIIDRIPFNYKGEYNYATIDIAEDRLFDWPMVYILANENSAYIGQTTSVISRMGQHEANVEKKDFDTVNIIFNEEFNASVITDYEHRLIGYMHADGRYQLTNKNDGMTDTNYFSKKEYSKMFEDLWGKLKDYDLTEHSIKEIEESEIFKYSPFKELNKEQSFALEKIKNAIKIGLNFSSPIVVEGMPGTGKTVLAIYLLKYLKDHDDYKDLNIKIVEPVTSLKRTLQKTLATVNGLSEKDVISPSEVIKPEFGYKSREKKNYDILLIDEAHKLKKRQNLANYKDYDRVNKELCLNKYSTQLDWIINQTKIPIFFYDPLQSIGPSCIGDKKMHEALGDSMSHTIKLESQMRVQGGDGYLNYIQNILNNKQQEKLTFQNYELELHSDFEDFIRNFNEKQTNHSLTRMAAGYAWEWKSKDNKKKNKNDYDIVIDNIKLKWNCVLENWIGKGFNDDEVSHEVGCIHTIQGYDLSYVYVIIGNDLMLDSKGKLTSNKNNYFDKNGKNTATKEELDQYIKNIYYVLLTRGIYGTHIYVQNHALRDYFARYFDIKY